MLPANAWKIAPAASHWDTPQQFLPTLKRPALLLIDGQEWFRNYYGSVAVGEMQTLLDEFRRRCLPVIFKLWPIPPSSEEIRRTGTCVPILPLKEVAPSTLSEVNRTVKYFEFDHLWKNPQIDRLLEAWDVDHVIIAGGFTEHCVIATVNALWSRQLPAIIPASAVGPHNATRREGHTTVPTGVPSVQHEAALIAMQSSNAQIVENTSAILEHLRAHSITGNLCPSANVPAPRPDYMRHAFPKQKEEWCNRTLHPTVNTSGIDAGLGAWPRWAPLEARHFLPGLEARS